MLDGVGFTAAQLMMLTCRCCRWVITIATAASKETELSDQVEARRLAGQVALITGAGTGIGACCALELARLGASVVLAGRRAEPLDDVAHKIVASAGSALAIPADVTSEEAMEDLVAQTMQRFGRLDFAVNSAGIGNKGSVLETDAAAFDRVMKTNVHGTFFALRAELKAMLATGGGAIVNVASIAGLRALPGLSAAYTTSKHAVVGLTRSVALEYATHGIRINAIAPGTTDTELLARLPGPVREKLAAASAMHRMAMPIEIVRGILYLLLDATYSTGLVLSADGGVATG